MLATCVSVKLQVRPASERGRERGREGERARGREGERARGREGERARGREGERARGREGGGYAGAVLFSPLFSFGPRACAAAVLCGDWEQLCQGWPRAVVHGVGAEPCHEEAILATGFRTFAKHMVARSAEYPGDVVVK